MKLKLLFSCATKMGFITELYKIYSSILEEFIQQLGRRTPNAFNKLVIQFSLTFLILCFRDTHMDGTKDTVASHLCFYVLRTHTWVEEKSLGSHISLFMF